MVRFRYECPVDDAGFTCPYWDDGLCDLRNPKEECDDYYAVMGDDEE